MRWGSVIIAMMLLPAFAVVAVADESSAETVWIYATYEYAGGSGKSYDPVQTGYYLDAERLAFYEKYAPWYHDEDDSPWDPHAIITGTVHIHNVYDPGPPDVHVKFYNGSTLVASYDLNIFVPISNTSALSGHTWISDDDGTEWTYNKYWTEPGTYTYHMKAEPTPPAPTPTPTPTPSGDDGKDDKTMQITIVSVAAGATVIVALVLGYLYIRRR